MQVIKRNGEIAEFNPDKIYRYLLKAAQTVCFVTDDLRQNCSQVTKGSFGFTRSQGGTCDYLSMIQSMVALCLLGAGHYHFAELHFLSFTQRDLERWFWRLYIAAFTF